MPSRKNLPLSAYPPRMVQWWLDGASKDTAVTFPTYSIAFDVRQKMYALRRCLIKENHPAAAFAQMCQISGPHPATPGAPNRSPHVLTIRRAGHAIDDYLSAAGIADPTAEPELDLPIPTGTGDTTND